MVLLPGAKPKSLVASPAQGYHTHYSLSMVRFAKLEMNIQILEKGVKTY
jgi:hypothetical protein